MKHNSGFSSLEQRLSDFLDLRGIDYKTTRQSYVFDCPSCSKEDHFYVRRRDGQSICFKCGVSFGWKMLVSKIAKCSVQNAYEILFGVGAGDLIGEQIDPFVFDLKEEEDEPVFLEKPVTLGMDFVPVLNSLNGLDYLVRRGIDDLQVIYDYDIRFHLLMNAVVFPIKKDGVMYGWQARKIAPEPHEIRMISHTFAKSKFLLNYDRAKVCSKIVLVEGPFDCVHVDVGGVGAVASLGKGVSQDQIKLILDSNASEIYLGLDDDAAEEIHSIVSIIGMGRDVFRIRPPNHREDFGETTADEFLISMKRAHRICGPSDVLEVYLKQ